MAAHCKLSLLDLGRLDVDDGFFIRGATAACSPTLIRPTTAVASRSSRR
jgi:hypothetical protein